MLVDQLSTVTGLIPVVVLIVMTLLHHVFVEMFVELCSKTEML